MLDFMLAKKNLFSSKYLFFENTAKNYHGILYQIISIYINLHKKLKSKHFKYTYIGNLK